MGWRNWLPTHGEQGGYVGPLSTYQEWHALYHGLYHGLVNWRPRPNGLPDNDDVQEETHMFKIGFVATTLFQYGFAAFALAVVFG